MNIGSPANDGARSLHQLQHDAHALRVSGRFREMAIMGPSEITVTLHPPVRQRIHR